MGAASSLLSSWGNADFVGPTAMTYALGLKGGYRVALFHGRLRLVPAQQSPWHDTHSHMGDGDRVAMRALYL